MLKKLCSYYNNSVLFKEKPMSLSKHNFLFFDKAEHEWLSIPKINISENELSLLKTLYELVEEPNDVTMISPHARAWKEFLMNNGSAPYSKEGEYCRIIQFKIESNQHLLANEVETALKGFFTDEIYIVWESPSQGIVIEEQNMTTLTEDEWMAMTDTMEADFYGAFSFYIGKSHPCTPHLREQYQLEREFFIFATHHLSDLKIFSYEKIFPAYLAVNLPDDLKVKVSRQIFETFKQDPETFATIKVFLENNLNASLTAKKLYIHRNTLQYRLDKFSESTGIGLKDFYGAFTVFLACQLFEYNNR